MCGWMGVFMFHVCVIRLGSRYIITYVNHVYLVCYSNVTSLIFPWLPMTAQIYIFVYIFFHRVRYGICKYYLYFNEYCNTYLVTLLSLSPLIYGYQPSHWLCHHYPHNYNVTLLWCHTTMTSLSPATMMSLTPLLWRRFPTMLQTQSITPLLWRQYPRYYDVTNPATMTSLTLLLWRH